MCHCKQTCPALALTQDQAQCSAVALMQDHHDKLGPTHQAFKDQAFTGVSWLRQASMFSFGPYARAILHRLFRVVRPSCGPQTQLERSSETC